MKTGNDLRMAYKMETGLEALIDFQIETTIPDLEDKTIKELEDPITIDVYGDDYSEEIPYINWLEEMVIKLSVDPFTERGEV